MFKLHAVQAEEGDCLILQSDDGALLIDGGPPHTWSAHLQPALAELRLTKVDLMMLSHVDGDHVTGLLDLMSSKFACHVSAVWHNAFSASVGEEIERRVVAILALEPARSIDQGSELAGRLGGIPLNVGFKGGLVSVESAPGPISIAGVELIVGGPNADCLAKLRDDWDKWLKANDVPSAR